MTKRMLIDANHPEETRVVAVNGNRLEEFDYETSTKKQLKGNIYLAKVTRVEPSLQAAFVDYGGNRHGFLAFSEIHPDYYRIPIADREALLAGENGDTDGTHDDGNGNADGNGSGSANHAAADRNGDPEVSGEPSDQEAEDDAEDGTEAASAEDSGETRSAGEDDDEDDGGERPSGRRGRGSRRRRRRVHTKDSEDVETVGGDEIDEVDDRRRNWYRKYRIQEVISRRQIMLVQVAKEERGNKGAALTTFISLAGRYCVLMPNTPRGGGISRKITNAGDRKRLKEMLEEFDIADGMAVIVRTAGMERNKAEVRRDYEYLVKLWDDIRERTLQSTAPVLVHEEGNLIKRSIRDLYTKDIDEILVEGEEGYKTAKAFMKMLMPSHARKVKRYDNETIPLLHRYQVEQQVDNIHSPVVQLKSGGYIVMNSTEALVAIDVNSGRSTRERNIEETAYRTNLEAAEEIARQLRLRDLAGLIVIDFIDMDEGRNRANVEKRLKEAMRSDRARIQLGRISPFGLLELSRQRLHPSVVEASMQTCPHCAGTGMVRSTESTSLHILRAIEEEGLRKRSAELNVFVPGEVALYVLNQKRHMLGEIESRHQLRVMIHADDTLVAPDHRIERVGLSSDEEGEERPRDQDRARDHNDAQGGRQGRRGRGRDRDESSDEAPSGESRGGDDEARAGNRDDDESKRESKGRRRGRRGGRRRRRGTDGAGQSSGDQAALESAEAGNETAMSGDLPAEAAEDLAKDDKAVKAAQDEGDATSSAADKVDEKEAGHDDGSGEEKPRKKAVSGARARSHKSDAKSGKKAPARSSARKKSPEKKKADGQDAPKDSKGGNGSEATEAGDMKPKPETAEGGSDSGKPRETNGKTPPAKDRDKDDDSKGRPRKTGWWALRR